MGNDNYPAGCFDSDINEHFDREANSGIAAEDAEDQALDRLYSEKKSKDFACYYSPDVMKVEESNDGYDVTFQFSVHVDKE